MDISRQNTRQKTPKTTNPPCTHVLRTKPVLGSDLIDPEPNTLSIARDLFPGVPTHPAFHPARSLASLFEWPSVTPLAIGVVYPKEV